MPRSRPTLTATAALAAVALLAVAGCREPAPAAHRGPIVLITIDALRADAVSALGGPPGLTPALDALAAEADWAGRAIAPSSWTVPSMASLMTGLQPWRHGNWHGGRTVLAPELTTLAEALKGGGYATAAFRSNHWLQKQFGYDQGFETFRYLREGKRAERHLAALDGGPDFVWVHVLPPHAPYVRRDHLLARLPAAPPDLPAKVRPLDLEPYYDPAVDLPPEVGDRFHAMYHLNAAWADELLGRLLAALRASGHWDEAIVVVTSDHGEEFGEHGQIAHGGNLGRALVEVPLVVKLPKGFGRPLALEPGRAVANLRVFSTLVEAAGGEPPAGAAPSLFERSAAPALSELYLDDGANLFSLVDGDLQLLWESRFAPPEPEYYRARLAQLGGAPLPPLAETPDAIFAREAASFVATPPLTGRAGAAPRLSLWRWTTAGSEPSADREAADRLARALKREWRQANGEETLPSARGGGDRPELSPEDVEELKALGYVAGGT